MTQGSSARDRFIEKHALLMEADGLPRIAGRLAGLFLVEGGPISFSELADRLQASRGSVSTNTRLLVERGIIERVSLPGERQDYFQLATRPHTLHLEKVALRLQAYVRNFEELMQAERHPAEITARLDHGRQFYAIAAEAIEEMHARLMTLPTMQDPPPEPRATRKRSPARR